MSGRKLKRATASIWNGWETRAEASSSAGNLPQTLISVRTGLGPARSAITSTLTVSMPLLLMGNPTSLWKN